MDRSTVLIKLLLSAYIVQVVQCGRSVLLTDGDTLYLKWQTRLGPLAQCSVLMPDGVEVPLSVGTNELRYLGDGYSSGQCGLRADNLVKPGTGNWTLKATALNGRQDQTTTQVTCIVKTWPRSIFIKVPIGTTQNITCGPQSALHCRMFSPTGQVSRHSGQCSERVKSVGSHHVNTWTCWAVTAESAAEVQYFVQLHVYQEGAVVDVGWNDTASEVRVFCNVRNSNNSTTIQSLYCKLSLPNDLETLSLAYGRGTSRYAYYGINDGDCGVSFPKPIKPTEIGRWKCMNVMTNHRMYGGFVNVATDRTFDNKEFSIDTVITKEPLTVPRGNAFNVECSVPAELDYCWLRHPNGTAISVTVPPNDHDLSRYRYVGEGLSFGQCYVSVSETSVFDTGSWLCALGLRGDRKEIYSWVNVTVTAYQQELYVAEGTDVTLGCYSVERQPIAYCRFLTPRLIGFAMDERSAKGSSKQLRYTYSGQGLTAGHCGLTINEVIESDYGNWTCAVKILDSFGSEEVSITVVLRKPEGFTMIQIIGIVFCGTLISVLSLFFANHLITSPSAKTRKKIEKLELLEAVEKGHRRVSSKRTIAASRAARTLPRRPCGTIPRRI
ncbi:uncharacterized protein LOC126908602 isoform X2 [Daktulosphaira vitifoliae]|uniref:uncharacterized protein LOC126908602 isoform X2 n=1 Tax=Daktulosphaira vitifoliae TaxID=58002 RepID=UPI0021AA11C9|nr:uncharacterized protein LOC126908602 isoform X2 [Daktulosphaira vitifoliae]